MYEIDMKYNDYRTIRFYSTTPPEIVVRKVNETDQKSEKTEKPINQYTCILRALYATKKYGCSGIAHNGECLVCEFRR